MWHGLICDIPNGWALCDGQNGTPDLRDRFVIGAPNGIDPGTPGGTTAHRHPVVGTTAEDDTSHNHEFTDEFTEPIEDDGSYDYEPVSGDYPLYRHHVHEFSGGTESEEVVHDHTMNFQTQLVSLKPPYYEILFIIKT